MVHEAGTWAIIETIIKPGQILCQISCLRPRLHCPLYRHAPAPFLFFFFFVCHTSKALLFDVAVGSGKLAKPIEWRRDKMMASRAEELKNFKSLLLQILCISVCVCVWRGCVLVDPVNFLPWYAAFPGVARLVLAKHCLFAYEICSSTTHWQHIYAIRCNRKRNRNRNCQLATANSQLSADTGIWKWEKGEKSKPRKKVLRWQNA